MNFYNKEIYLPGKVLLKENQEINQLLKLKAQELEKIIDHQNVHLIKSVYHQIIDQF
jgi:hypothetical protein